MTRPFKGLARSRGPDAHYEVVIIGSGIGGLILANLLIDQGLRVLLVERHYMVGGFCSTFQRKRFTFDAASHFYPLLGNPQSLTGKLIAQFNLPNGWHKMDPVDHFHFPDGDTFRVPAELNDYLQLLQKKFPHEQENLDRFFEQTKTANLHGLLHFFRRRTSKWYQSQAQRTLKEVLDTHIVDPKLKLLLTADVPHWGGPPSQVSFVFDSMLRMSYFLGNYYPEGGSQTFSDNLAARFEQRGGHILMKTACTRIHLEGGAAKSVALTIGQGAQAQDHVVRTDFVAANSDMHQTLNHLIGAEHLPKSLLQSVNLLKPSYPCFLAYLGLKDVDSALLARIQGYYWNDWNTENLGRNGLRFKIFVPTLLEPKMAPEGCHVVIIQKVQELPFDDVTDWAQQKADTEAYVRGYLNELIPDLDQKLVTWTAASAMTSVRFTGNFQGGMLGWAMDPSQLGDGRPDIQSPIPNLFFTGHWTRPGGGITPVIVSAMHVAEDLTKEVHRRKAQPPKPR